MEVGEKPWLTIMTNVTGPMKLQMKWLSTLSQQLKHEQSQQSDAILNTTCSPTALGVI